MITTLDQIDDRNSTLEMAGDFFLTPARLFFGNTYYLEPLQGENGLLKQPETFISLTRIAQKVAALVLFPISMISSFFGLTLKWVAHQMNPDLKNKYTLPVLINARTDENFSGKLPPNPWTPNCVSQESSFWGPLYQTAPLEGSLQSLKQVMDARKAVLVEEKGNYLHYTETVNIPSGPLKGVYIDDIDFYYSEEKGVILVRSASRTGFRDALHLDFSQPGANWKRIEAIREALRSYPK